MNEKIRELSETCYTTKYNPFGADEEKYDMEKFAELIIKECAEQIIAKGTDWVDFAPSQTGVRPEYWDMAQHIKQHFGIEE